MPYSEAVAGIYRISNVLEQTSYVGQSKNLRKRLGEHRRLLRKNIHPNPHLQQSFCRHGESAFEFVVEAVFEDPTELDVVEEAFLANEAWFDGGPRLFNVSSTARRPMKNRCHTEATKRQISVSKRGNTQHVTPEYRRKLAEGQLKRLLSDPSFVAKIRYIVDNPDMSYAERGRVLGIDTSSVRKLALRYNHLKGQL